MPGARCARSLVCELKKHTSVVTTVTPESPGIPRAMVLTVSFVLLGDRACLPPSSAKVAFRHLDASVGASGPHDFAVRGQAPSSLAPPASTASRPAFVTIASRPSVGRDSRGCIADLGQGSTTPTAADWHDGQISLVARMSTSDMREQWQHENPGCRFAHPGYG
jgi:hypothetical protein